MAERIHGDLRVVRGGDQTRDERGVVDIEKLRTSRKWDAMKTVSELRDRTRAAQREVLTGLREIAVSHEAILADSTHQQPTGEGPKLVDANFDPGNMYKEVQDVKVPHGGQSWAVERAREGFTEFNGVIREWTATLLDAMRVSTGEWQAFLDEQTREQGMQAGDANDPEYRAWVDHQNQGVTQALEVFRVADVSSAAHTPDRPSGEKGVVNIDQLKVAKKRQVMEALFDLGERTHSAQAKMWQGLAAIVEVSDPESGGLRLVADEHDGAADDPNQALERTRAGEQKFNLLVREWRTVLLDAAEITPAEWSAFIRDVSRRQQADNAVLASPDTVSEAPTPRRVTTESLIKQAVMDGVLSNADIAACQEATTSYAAGPFADAMVKGYEAAGIGKAGPGTLSYSYTSGEKIAKLLRDKGERGREVAQKIYEAHYHNLLDTHRRKDARGLICAMITLRQVENMGTYYLGAEEWTDWRSFPPDILDASEIDWRGIASELRPKTDRGDPWKEASTRAFVTVIEENFLGKV